MVILDYIGYLSNVKSDPNYKTALRELINVENEWKDKLSADQICLVLNELSKSDLVNEFKDIAVIKLFEKYDNICQTANQSSYSDFLRQWSELLINNDDRDGSYQKCCEYIYNTCKGEDVADKITLYSFRGTSDYVINDIENNTLSYQLPSQFNDPLDTLLFKWIDFKINGSLDDKQKELYYLIKRAAEHLRVRCFVKPSSNDKNLLEVEQIHPLMWAHYAESHKGMCIQYCFTKDYFHNKKSDLSFKRIQHEIYTSGAPNLNNDITILNALFTKDKVWEYEEEVRIIDLDFKENKGIKVDPLHDKAMIEAIYLGYHCNDEIKTKVANAIRNTSIKLYQMVIEDNNLNQLKARRIS